MLNTRPVTEKPGTLIQLSAAMAVLLPMAGLTVWMYLLRDSSPGLLEFFLGPLLFGGGMIFWILYLHVGPCRDHLSSLGLLGHGWWRDIAVGTVLGSAFLALKAVTQPLLNRLFAPRPPSQEIIQLIEGVSQDPCLLVLWLGPVVWIGIAGFEELWRVFILRRLWNVFTSPAGQWTVLLFVSALVGLAHAYQGPAAIVSIGIKSVLMAWYFKSRGRCRPLIVAHAVYDSVQIVMAVVAMRGYS